MKSKAWWKNNWLSVFGVICGVASVTAATLAVGFLALFMAVVGFCVAVLGHDLWKAQDD